MASSTEFGDEIPDGIFSTKESLKARWKEIKYSISLLRKSPLFIIGFIVFIFLLILALSAPFITNYGPHEIAKFDLVSDVDVRLPPMTIDRRESLFWTDFTDITENFDGINPGVRVKTTTTDLNGDGKIDILVGTGDGNLLYYSNNEFNSTAWSKTTNYALPQVPAQLSNISPTTGDINGDQTEDIIIGADDGKLYLSLNQGTSENPLWSAFSPLKTSNDNEIILPDAGNPGLTNPTLANVNGDTEKKLDLLVGSNNYTIFVFENKGNLTNFSFEYNPTMPKNSVGQKLLLNETSGSGDFQIKYEKVDNNARGDMIIIFADGNYYLFLSFDIIYDPYYIMINKDADSETFKFPKLNAEPNFDFNWFDLTSDGWADVIQFSNNGSVYFAEQELIEDGRTHYLGTDERGGDIFSRIIWALQLDLILAIWVVSFALIIGILVGAIAGYYGGWIDQLMMRITDVFFAFPGLILAMAIAAALGRNMLNLSIALIVVWWSGYARIIRGQVISEKNKLYVEAARATGLGNVRIIFRHVLPNSIYPVLVSATLDLGGVILTAAGLSFIGFGANAGDAELGRMIADGRQFFLNSPHIVFFPGLVIAIIVLAFNLVGDGLRDIMDPRVRR